jgi:hypothetical protein
VTAATRTQWVFRSACGCPLGVLEGDNARNEYEAWLEFYERKSEINKAIGSGITVQHMSHEEYCSETLPILRSTAPCPHGGVS